MPAALRVVCFGVALLLPSLAGAQQPASNAVAGERAFLDVTINGVAKGDTLVVLRPGDALVSAAWLTSAGIQRVAGTREAIDGEPFVSLASLAPALTFRFDERELMLVMTAEPGLLAATVRDLGEGRPEGIVYQRDSSAFVNYALDLGTGRDYDLFSEAGVSVGGALLSTTIAAGDRGVVRGLTSLTVDDRSHIRRWVAGDSFVSTGPLGGDALVGGVTLTREFSIEPYFVRHPTFSISAPVMTPSTVEVHVNGRVVREEQVGPGRLDIRNLPLTTGHNDTRIVVRDPFGGTREIDTSYYSTATALARGIHDYQYSLGWRRDSLTTESWAYTTPVFLARHRVGVTDWVTAGGRAEASANLVSGGPFVNLRLPIGEVEAGLAASRAGTLTGQATSGAYVYAGQRGSVGGSLRRTSRHYANVSLAAADRRAPLEATLFAGAPVGPVTLSAQHAYMPLADGGARQRSEISASARAGRRGQLMVSVARVDDGVRRGLEVTSGLTIMFGARTSATTTVGRGREGVRSSVDVQRSLPSGTGYGYQLRMSDGIASLPSLVAQAQGPHGRYEVRADSSGGSTHTTVSVAGAVVAIGGGLFTTRPVRGSYALVQVPGVKDVRGYSSNQEIGRTDGKGNFFVPDLLPYYGNLLNIADTDVPIDFTISKVQATVAPPYRGGALVRFPVQRIQRSQGRVRIVSGGVELTPTYGQLTITAEGVPSVSPLGTGGEFYFENLPAGRHAAVVEGVDNVCRFVIDVPAGDGAVADLGIVRCTAGEEQ